MIRKFLFMAAALCVSVNAYSIEIMNGKLLEHKQWSTANQSQVAFKEKTFDKALLQVFLNKHKNNFGIMTGASARLFDFPDTVDVGTKYSTRARTSVILLNNLQTSKIFTINQKICFGRPQSCEASCTYDRSKIQLDSGGYLSFMQVPQLDILFNQAGFYEIWVDNDIVVENANGTTGEDASDLFEAYDNILVNAVDSTKK